MDKLINEFLNAIRVMSFHNAAEGEMWFREERQRNEAYNRLMSVKKEMVATYGKEKTQEIISQTPNLCFSELDLD